MATINEEDEGEEEEKEEEKEEEEEKKRFRVNQVDRVFHQISFEIATGDAKMQQLQNQFTCQSNS